MAEFELEPGLAPVPETEYEDPAGGSYGTGSTTPPKDRAGAVGLVLTLVILFCSVTSALNLLNVRLFSGFTPVVRTNQVTSASAGKVTAGLESASDPTAPTQPQDNAVSEKDRLQIIAGAPSVENVPVAGALSWQKVYEKVIPSVVSVICTGNGYQSTGTGVVMSESGYVITNAHVVEGAAAVSVLLTDGRTLEAELVGADTASDLAVLWVSSDGLVAAEFGDSTALRVGDAVVAIGDPLGVELRGTMTDGIISAINRDLKVGSRTMNLIQTSAALNSGNSGGPLVNCYGQVVGINTVKISDYASSGGVEGLGFAIPITTVKDVVDQIVTYGYVTGRPTLGITGEAVSRFYQYYYGLPAGLVISKVTENSDAAAHGIRSGDILLSLDGTAVTDQDILDELVSARSVGDEMEAVIYRAGTEYVLDLTVTEERPD